MNEIKAIGIDAGSTTCKVVAVDQKGDIVLHKLEQAHPLIERQTSQLIEEILIEHQLEEKNIPIVATGYGRKLVKKARKKITEITCHSKGIFRELGRGGTLLDIGGQDSKVIKIGDNGQTIDFVMNDKCAAGTGRFLEQTAARLRVPLEEIGEQSLRASEEQKISSTCTVFAESEIISLLAHGASIESILLGLHRSLAHRTIAMIHSIGFEPPLMLSGGVALNRAFRKIIAELLHTDIILPKYPQLMGAYGAALIALSQKIASKND